MTSRHNPSSLFQGIFIFHFKNVTNIFFTPCREREVSTSRPNQTHSNDEYLCKSTHDRINVTGRRQKYVCIPKNNFEFFWIRILVSEKMIQNIQLDTGRSL